jgi:DNA invertase Pin-like site-specific DNA recombinase
VNSINAGPGETQDPAPLPNRLFRFRSFGGSLVTGNDKTSVFEVAAWSIDRVGRSLGHLVDFMDELRAQNVGLYLHQQQIDTSTAAGRAFLQMAGVFAEFERSIIVERVRAGVARAKAQGKTLGRPPVSGHVVRRIKALRRAGHGKLWIAREIHCGVGTVQRVLAP